ncbi:hypothetical protein F0562_018959 [Nyssa sinensis]|uniref:EF-hand domain-containing protein n=1 Tax=Nyssa sinensis TaxID=561372 RepID=A0A5J4ZAG3_9ASTE|nr:hypothetical protein F0562_018959 [Nyssa sinensis]
MNRRKGRKREIELLSSPLSLRDSPRVKELDENATSSDLPFFYLSTIVAATDNFSSANKLGQGGFGSVYKVIHLDMINISAFFHFPQSTMETRRAVQYFEDLLPVMAERLGGEGLIEELCKGFRLLMDGEKEVITFESLKRNSALLGLQDLRDDEIQSMVREGDLDGDGALNQMEFCVLMFRLTPELMDVAGRLLDEALLQNLSH